jgi:flagellin-like hook-associated protein FlgL
MAINTSITLTQGMRTNLLSLQKTNVLMETTQTRLASGLKVNSALDDPINYFAAQSHRQRASDLDLRKNGMDEAIQTIKAADAGISAISALLTQAKSLVTSARSASASEAADLQTQYDDILLQIDTLATDSNYKGTNLLDSDTLTVEFNEDASSTLDVAGFDGSSTGLALTAGLDFTDPADLDTAVSELDAAIDTLRTQEKTLSNNLSIVTTRQEFTQSMIDTLLTGADKLTLADMNEEGANMLMLQTRMALGTTSLSLASEAAQSVLRLF